jgi:hypothetical protein
VNLFQHIFLNKISHYSYQSLVANRDKLRYPSHLTDEEWRHIEPLSRVPTRALLPILC